MANGHGGLHVHDKQASVNPDGLLHLSESGVFSALTSGQSMLYQ